MRKRTESPLHVSTQCMIIQNARQTNNFHALGHMWGRPTLASSVLKDAAALQRILYIVTGIDTGVPRVGFLETGAETGRGEALFEDRSGSRNNNNPLIAELAA